MALSNEVIKSKSNLDSFINHFDMSSYDELFDAFNEVHKNLTSLCMKNKAVKLEVSWLLTETEALNENSKANEEMWKEKLKVASTSKWHKHCNF